VDSLGALIPFALAAAYLFARFAGRKRPETAAKSPRPTQRTAGSTAGPTPFEQLLARLEEQRGPTAAASVVPRREPDVVARERAAHAATKARAEAATAFRSSRRPTAPAGAHVGMSAEHGFDHEARDFDREAAGFEHERRDFEHDRHGFESDNPYSEEALERARDADLRSSRPDRLAYDPHTGPEAPPPARAETLAQRLRSPSSLRDAFVLSAVLALRPPLRRSRR
jgi:hypothetical protein